MGRKVLVTGGAGFIGSHIVEDLLAAGHEVAVLDNLSSGKSEQVPEGVELFKLDITGDIDAAFVAFQPDAVVHQAAQVSVSYSVSEPQFDARTNILGSINIIQAACKHGVRKVTYASSAAAYGPLETLPLQEDMRPQPVSPYGTSKYTVEHYLRTAKREQGLEWAALRYSNVYGPRQDPHGEAGVIAIFCQLLLEGKSPTIYGGGDLTRDYIFVQDVARANRLLLEADLSEHPDPVFNCSTQLPTTTNRLFELLRDGFGADVEPVDGGWRPGDVAHSLLDNSKLRGTVDWQPSVALEDGIRQTVQFFRPGVNV